MIDLILAAGVFAAVFVPTIVYLTNSIGAADLNRHALRRMSPDTAIDDDLDITRRRMSDSGPVGAWLAKLDLVRILEENMWQAGLYMRLGDMILFIVILFGIGVAAGAFVWQDALYSFGSGLALGSLPILYTRIRRQRRIKAFAKQLPFALDLIKSSLQAGHSLQRALQVLVGEFADPLGTEFRTVLEQTRIGLPLPRALEELLRRVPEDDLRLMVVAVKVQAAVGSSLAEIAGRLSQLVRARQRLRLQIQALTAQARFGGILVGLLPFIVLGAFSIIEPSYTQMLFHDPAGLKILKTALVADLLAFVWIRRLLKVSY